MKKIFLILMMLLMTSTLGSLPAHATVSSTTSKIIYSGNGVTTVFSFPFNIYLTSDLSVQKLVVATGVLTTLSLNIDYTVTLSHSAPTTGTITLGVALPAGTNLVILRSIPYTQLISIADNSPTPASVTNQAYDRGVMLSQQLLEQVSRSILQNAFSTTNLTFPSPVAGQCVGWSGSSTLTNLNCSGSGGGGTGFNPPIPDSQLATITTGSKVNASAIYSLPSMPSGAGLLPLANIPVGTSANNIVQLNGSAQLPAVSGTNVTSINGANFTNLTSIPSGAGIIPQANLPALTQNFVPNNIQVFTGNGTWTKPVGVSTAYVKVWGAGGGSGGANGASGHGGGGGAYCEGYVTVTGNVTVLVGAGGTAGSAGADDAGTGGTSSFAGSTTLTATGGGGGGRGGAGGAGGAGGTASNGQINISGQSGGTGVGSSTGSLSGSGGGSFGFSGALSAFTITGAGTLAGIAGTGYGAGASGASRISAGTAAGAAGAGGLVIVYY